MSRLCVFSLHTSVHTRYLLPMGILAVALWDLLLGFTG
jgi:hypothetical protein